MDDYIRRKRHLEKMKKKNVRTFMNWKRKEHENN